MLEMAGGDRIGYEPEVLYRYHCEMGSGQRRYGEYYAIQSYMNWRSRHMPQYLPLETLADEPILQLGSQVQYSLICVHPGLMLETTQNLGFR
jgi:hypothetical protein